MQKSVVSWKHLDLQANVYNLSYFLLFHKNCSATHISNDGIPEKDM